MFGFTKQRFYQLVDAAEIERDIVDNPNTKCPESTMVDSVPERTLRPMKKVEPSARASVFEEAVREAEVENDERPVITERHIKAAIAKLNPEPKVKTTDEDRFSDLLDCLGKAARIADEIGTNEDVYDALAVTAEQVLTWRDPKADRSIGSSVEASPEDQSKWTECIARCVKMPRTVRQAMVIFERESGTRGVPANLLPVRAIDLYRLVQNVYVDARPARSNPAGGKAGR